ncbi:MAG TPA: adenylate/guanylate cyclase domain-containing protein [Methylomirabilota bacterium]|nr:adenylate/guanylate cyclase domain-containing protein [Methylomirabilota bacterium]
MTFDEVLAQVQALLAREGRVSYRALKLRFNLDEAFIEGLKDELIKAKQLARDEEGAVLIWTGSGSPAETYSSEPLPLSASLLSLTSSVAAPQPPAFHFRAFSAHRPAAERRQITVMFCDLVGSTALAEQLDPEELHEVMQVYQTACTAVVERFAGYIAQYLGDGLLVYFGYPVAHEDDAQRAVRAGLEIVEVVQALPLSHLRLPHPLQARIGIHTGLVVVGEVGGGEKRETLALGETPNLAARLQALAEPGTVVLSAATHRLIAGLFACEARGPSTLKGSSRPLALYRVVRESEAQSRFEVALRTGLMPLVGRNLEVHLLQACWRQAVSGNGQIILLSGEAGIGKSRLVQTLKEHVIAEGATRIEFRCSPYHYNSAFYPIIEHLQRLLLFTSTDSPQEKLEKLEQTLACYRFPQADTLPLFAALLALPHPPDAPPIMLSPQKQRQKTQEALLAWLVEEAERSAVYCAWEDLQWIDPSTLELLTLVLEQTPTTRLLALLTFRPDFIPPWRPHLHLTQLTLSRLGRQQVEWMVAQLTGGKALPLEVLREIVAKTDGVPLFVEELTKMVLESGLLTTVDDHYELTGSLPPLAIPSTLQDSLMARLDRLAPVREIAQMSAALGREFSYELLHAVLPLHETILQQGLRQLVEAELIYQRGRLPQATYSFKHVLVQDTAYQSLLKSKRQQYHQRVARVLEERFAETCETQPELLAHHCTEAGLIAQAIPYWQRAGQRAMERSANMEAISHLTKGLQLLQTLPDSSDRVQQELALQIPLGVSLVMTKGYAAPEVGQAYARARELYRQVRETPQLLPVLWGLWQFYIVRAELQTAYELGEQLLTAAQRAQDSTLLMGAHQALGVTLFHLGELVSARAHLEQGVALYNLQQHGSLAFLFGQDPGVACCSFAALTLWLLGYPEQAGEKLSRALVLAQELSHPFSQAFTHFFAAWLAQFRREEREVYEQVEMLLTLSHEQGFLQWLAMGPLLQGWALVNRGQRTEGIAQIRQGLAAFRSTGARMLLPYFSALLAEAYGSAQPKGGLGVLTEAETEMQNSGERFCEAELYRLKGELTLQQHRERAAGSGQREKGADPQPPILDPQAETEAEACFFKAINIACKQQARMWELRATVSLARLWQRQGRRHEAQHRLAESYHGFTEGFDTQDLQEAQVLLEELA